MSFNSLATDFRMHCWLVGAYGNIIAEKEENQCLLVVLLRLVATAGREFVHPVDGACLFFGDAGL